MICPKCNSECKDDFCVKCGMMINFMNKTDISKITKEAPHERDLELFIGDNAHKIIYNNFNLYIGVFNYLWFLYRKCYVFGTLLFLFNIVIFYILVIKLHMEFIIYFFFSFIIFSIFGNSIYLIIAKQKTKRIASKENYKQKLIRKGGTNIIGVLIGIIALSFIILFYIVNY